MSGAITVKGTREGLLITMGDGDIGDLLIELKGLFESRNTFFRGGIVAVEVGDRRLTARDVARMREVFKESGVTLQAILGTNPSSRDLVKKMGLGTSVETKLPPSLAEGPPRPEFIAGTGMLVQRTLRSGQSVCHAGHVVIIGDVNPGAEVIAGGDIIVWGHLRGIVHAGATGDEERYVCALNLSPTQLRIGNHVARPPEGKRSRKQSQPERAYISNGQIVAERWQ
jgi:septum site-determining protein MinC